MDLITHSLTAGHPLVVSACLLPFPLGIRSGPYPAVRALSLSTMDLITHSLTDGHPYSAFAV